MLGTKIQQLRHERNLTLTQLAKKTEISKSYLSHIERSIQANPSIEVLAKIAAALDVDIKNLLSPESLISKPYAKKEPIKDWSNLINTALEAGLIDEEDLREINQAIKNGISKK
ncbi:helix-turn-helix domain-containing protein [Neobacillus dielmonensis]|uniref:helix-turn-helix domain-containing protein n=1 Tax=Neobacillus dielmonensis TaxID=1347369 RepID=UPI0005A982EF|nr:helix-turn-helix transcriptional regulator [Neobacillus dielmonensis]